MEVGYPVDVEVEGNERVQANELPGGKCAVATYKGPHEEIADAHRAVHSWMHDNDIKATGEPAREVYLTDLRNLGEGDECRAESVWPIVHETARRAPPPAAEAVLTYPTGETLPSWISESAITSTPISTKRSRS